MQLIGLAVVLAASLVLAPLAAEAQPAGKIYRIGYLSGKPQADHRKRSSTGMPTVISIDSSGSLKSR